MIKFLRMLDKSPVYMDSLTHRILFRRNSQYNISAPPGIYRDNAQLDTKVLHNAEIPIVVRYLELLFPSSVTHCRFFGHVQCPYS